MDYEQANYSPSIFVGREKELSKINDLLTTHREGGKWILTLYGDGGIGKTQLLQRYVDIVSEEKKKSNDRILAMDKPVDLYLTAHQLEKGILKEIASQLAPDEFNDFLESVEKNENITLEKLRNSFLDIYSSIDAHQIILFFDTTELASEGAKTFFYEMLPKLKHVNQNTFIVSAGRKFLTMLPPDSAEQINLSGLSIKDVTEYFEQQDFPLSQKEIEKLTHLSRGRPILLGLTLDWLKFGHAPEELLETTPEKFEQAVVERITQLLFPEDQVILLAAHLYRRFNEEILACVFDVSPQEARNLEKALSRFSFIKYRSINNETHSCLLHDEMRELINKHVWMFFDPSGEQRREWSKKVIAYYDAQIKQEPSIIETKNLERERLHYLLDADVNEGYSYWYTLIKQAKTPDEREALNTEILKYQQKLSEIQLLEIEVRKADIAVSRGNYPRSTEKLESVIQHSYCEKIEGYKLKARILSRLILSYTNSGDVPKAIEKGEGYKSWFETKLNEVDKNSDLYKALNHHFARVHNLLGYAYRKQGDKDKPKEYYKKALGLLKGLEDADVKLTIASIKTNLGYALHLLGEDLEAISQCKTALRIKKKLDNPYQLGLTYNVLGMIEADSLREQRAIDYFQQALDCFNDAKNERGKALVYIAYGRMLRQLGWYEVKPQRGNVSIDEYQQAGKMLDTAIHILRDSDRSSLPEALNEKATLLREQEHWGQAIKYYQESKILAEEDYNYYLVADNLQDLGITYYLQENYPDALKFSNEAIDIARKFGSSHILGRAQRTVANVYFKQEDYSSAFCCAEESIDNILKIDPNSHTDTRGKKEEFSKEWQQWVTEMVFALPSNVRKKHAEPLLIHWEQHEYNAIGEDYSGFITSVEDALNT